MATRRRASWVSGSESRDGSLLGRRSRDLGGSHSGGGRHDGVSIVACPTPTVLGISVGAKIKIHKTGEGG